MLEAVTINVRGVIVVREAMTIAEWALTIVRGL